VATRFRKWPYLAILDQVDAIPDVQRDPGRRTELLGSMLRWRRAQLTRADVGLPPRLGARGGLTQDDLAELTGYTVRMVGQLEHGRLRSPSAHLLDSVARGLRLGAEERRTLWLLAAGTMPPSSRFESRTDSGLARLVDALYPNPAYVTDAIWDVQAYNAGVAEWFVDFNAVPPNERNIAKWIFCHPHARHVFVNWADDFARLFISRMRAVVAHLPDNEDLNRLIDELRRRSEFFDSAWAAAADVYVDPPTETRVFRRPGHTDPRQADDAEHHVHIEMVILGPMRPDDERRLVAFLLPDSEPHHTHLLSEQECTACSTGTTGSGADGHPPT